MKALDIREKRKKLGYTQKDLANLIGVSVQTINNYENGKEIPSTKYQILDKILNSDEAEILKEPDSDYEINESNCIQKVKNLKNELKLKDEIILLLREKIDLMKEQSN